MRMIALGGAALAQGFALLGFETRPDATVEDLEQVLQELLRSDAKALVIVEHSLAEAGGPAFRRVRAEGGRIVISEVPPLHAPADYRPPVEALVRRVLGPNALEKSL